MGENKGFLLTIIRATPYGDSDLLKIVVVLRKGDLINTPSEWLSLLDIPDIEFCTLHSVEPIDDVVVIFSKGDSI